MQQLWQRDNVTNLSLELIVLIGQIKDNPFAVCLPEIGFIIFGCAIFVDVLNVVQGSVAYINFGHSVTKSIELRAKKKLG